MAVVLRGATVAVTAAVSTATAAVIALRVASIAIVARGHPAPKALRCAVDRPAPTTAVVRIVDPAAGNSTATVAAAPTAARVPRARMADPHRRPR